MIHININRWPYLEWHRIEKSEAFIGWAAIGVCIVSSGTYNSFAKALSGYLSPLGILFISELLTLLFVLFSFGLMPTVRKLSAMPRNLLAPMILVGLLNSTLAPLLMFRGLQSSTAVNASLFSNAEMVFLILFAVVVLRETFTRVHALSVCAMIGGIITIALRGFTHGIELLPGDALIILAGAVYACGSIIFRKFLYHIDSSVLLFMRSLAAIGTFMILLPFFERSLAGQIQALPLAVIPILLGFGFLSKFLNVFSFYESLDRLKVTTVSLLMNLSVIVGVVVAHVFLGETIEGYHYVGGALLILGSILLEFAGTHNTEAELEGHLKQRQVHRA